MTTAAALDPRPSQVARTRLADLVGRSGVPGLAALSAGDGAVEVSGMTLDSRAVRPGDLYAALPGGQTHGALFCPAAVDAGAAAVLTDPAGRNLISGRAGAPAPGVPVVVAEQPRRLDAVDLDVPVLHRAPEQAVAHAPADHQRPPAALMHSTRQL